MLRSQTDAGILRSGIGDLHSTGGELIIRVEVGKRTVTTVIKGWRAMVGTLLHVFQLLLIHPKVVPEFVQNRLTHLVANLGVAHAHCLDILLIEYDAVWTM